MHLLMAIPISMALALAVQAAPAEAEPGAVTDAEWAQITTTTDRFMRRVAESLGASARPRHWALAALALAAADARSEKEAFAPQRAVLLGRTYVAAPQDRFVLWQVALNCPKSETCREHDALARLQQLEPDNAAVWALGARREQGGNALPGSDPTDHAPVRAALAHAAKASRFDMHLGEVLAESFSALESVPVDRDLARRYFAAQDDFPHTEFAVRSAVAFGFVLASIAPYQSPFTALCRSEDPKQDAALRSDCLAYSRLLARTEGDLMNPRIGLETIHALVQGTAAETANAAEIRSLDWLTETSRRPEINRFANDAELAAYLEDWKQGGELHAIRQRMAMAGIALEPPADFRSRSIAH